MKDHPEHINEGAALHFFIFHFPIHMRLFLFIALVALMQCGCKPTCQKWLSKHGHMLRDTVTTYTKVTDTVTITTEGDTITLRDVLRDTVVQSGKATISLKLDTLWRVKYLRATCNPDTFTKYVWINKPTITIRETPIVPKEDGWQMPWWVKVLICCLALVSLFLTIKKA